MTRGSRCMHGLNRTSLAGCTAKACTQQRIAAFMVLIGLLVWGFAGPGASIAQAQVDPNPPTSSFIYIPLSPSNPVYTHYSYIGTFWVQYRYGANGLDWWFRIAPKWVQEAGNNKVTLDFTVTTRGKQV